MPHIMIDRAFQRKVCWSEKTCREFILSANRGRAFYPVVVADVASGLVRSENSGSEYSLLKYEEADRLRKDYISLDGQNRSMAWKKLFNDEVHLQGTFVDADGEEVEVFNTTYSQLPERLQDALRDTEVILAVAKGCLYDELHEIFVNINSGDALNAQEIRNAINTPISDFVRKMSERDYYIDCISSISGFDNAKFSRSYDAEYIAKAYMATLQIDGRAFNAGKKDLDSFYLIGKGKRVQNVPEYSKMNQIRFINILEKQCKLLKNQTKVPQKTWWLALYIAEKLLVDEEIAINDYSELYGIITILDSKLNDESRSQMGKDLEDWKTNGEIPEDKPVSHNYYHQWCVDPKSHVLRSRRKKKFFSELLKREDYLALVESSKITETA